ncbi:MAG: hypothetical protein AAF004_08975 [Pseudomonadota bacterium]
MKIAHLSKIAREGFADMLPALQTAFNSSGDDDDLASVFGARPRTAIVALTVVTIALGYLVGIALESFQLSRWVHWPVVCVAVGFALPVRRYLFSSNQAGDADFPWLAAVVIPAVCLLALLTFFSQMTSGEVTVLDDAPFWTVIGAVLIWAANAVGEGATVTLAFCALVYSRNWLEAMWDVVRLVFILKLIQWVFVTILLEIGIVDAIVSHIAENILGFNIPHWAGDLSDQISYGVLVLAMGLAVIGATWTVCRRSFAELLAKGDINVAATVRTMIDPPDPKKVAQKAEKAKHKAARKAAREAARQAARDAKKHKER